MAAGATTWDTAMVTGASSGIGAAFARRLAAEGAALILVARDAVALRATAYDLTARGAPSVEVLAADLTDPADLRRVCDRVGDPDRPVDLLVNNAGMALGRGFPDTTDDELRNQLDLNVTAVLLLCRAAVPAMTARRHGAVINVASIAGLVPNPGANYAATKAWVVSFTEGLAISLRRTPVRVQALCPGLVRTEFHRRAGLTLTGTPRFSWIDVDLVVRTSLADLRRDRVVSVPSVLYRGVAVLTKLLPRRANRALAGLVYDRRG